MKKARTYFWKYAKSLPNKISIVVYLASPLGFSLEAQNPLSLCARFESAVDKTYCEDQMTDLRPSWYLASYCEKQKDHKTFYQCLFISKKHNLSASHISTCAAQESSATKDQDRLTCLESPHEQASVMAPPYPAPSKRAPTGSQKFKEGY